MKQRFSIQIGLAVFFLLLTQSMLLLHASEHQLHNANQVDCKVCQVSDNLNSPLASGTFDFAVTPVKVVEIAIPSFPYIASFKASSPLPRAPPIA